MRRRGFVIRGVANRIYPALVPGKGRSVMKRIALGLAVVFALVLGGVFANTASAHGPHGHGHGHHHHGHYHCRPSYGGYYAPYTAYPYPSYPGYLYARPQPRVGFY